MPIFEIVPVLPIAAVKISINMFYWIFKLLPRPHCPVEICGESFWSQCQQQQKCHWCQCDQHSSQVFSNKEETGRWVCDGWCDNSCL